MIISNIDWDNTNSNNNLPQEVIPDEKIYPYIVDGISEYLSDTYECCVNNYNIDIVNPTPEITKTMTIDDINKQKDEKNYIEGNIIVSLDDILDINIEDFMDILSTKLTGSPLLMDIGYQIIGTQNNNLIIHVTGDASSILDE